MSDEAVETTQEVEPGEEEVQDAPTEPTPETEQQAPDTVDGLPDWAKKLVTDLRKENASHRKAKKAAEKEAETAAQKAAEEQGEFKRLYEETKAKLEAEQTARQAAELASLRAKVAGKHKLPGPLADRLQGETEEELEADAVSLLEALPKPAANTDSGNGTNASAPTPKMTDDEIRERAVRLGVSFEHLKKQIEKE